MHVYGDKMSANDGWGEKIASYIFRRVSMASVISVQKCELQVYLRGINGKLGTKIFFVSEFQGGTKVLK